MGGWASRAPLSAETTARKTLPSLPGLAKATWRPSMERNGGLNAARAERRTGGPPARANLKIRLEPLPCSRQNTPFPVPPQVGKLSLGPLVNAEETPVCRSIFQARSPLEELLPNTTVRPSWQALGPV